MDKKATIRPDRHPNATNRCKKQITAALCCEAAIAFGAAAPFFTTCCGYYGVISRVEVGENGGFFSLNITARACMIGITSSQQTVFFMDEKAELTRMY
ncbi:MAG: hypothetical protein HRT35_25265 [Algicola sp.]|nr:hypothetical protein [Algicola sp.]